MFPLRWGSAACWLAAEPFMSTCGCGCPPFKWWTRLIPFICSMLLNASWWSAIPSPSKPKLKQLKHSSVSLLVHFTANRCSTGKLHFFQVNFQVPLGQLTKFKSVELWLVQVPKTRSRPSWVDVATSSNIKGNKANSSKLEYMSWRLLWYRSKFEERRNKHSQIATIHLMYGLRSILLGVYHWSIDVLL